MTTLYLASGSPRRQELLTQLGFSFEQVVPGIEEQRRAQESAQQYVVRLAREKAQAGVALVPRDLPVLGADTIVVLNGEVLEKPRDAAHAAECCVCFPEYASGDDCCCACGLAADAGLSGGNGGDFPHAFCAGYYWLCRQRRAFR